jgi:hypothetical protein
MLSHQKMPAVLLAAIMTTALSAPALAGAMMPKPVHQGDVTYVSGGIGLDEQHALEAAARNYNLEITNADRKGEFTVGTNLVIKNKSGHDMLRATDTGPLFYAKLPPGAYTIQATSGDQQRVRHVTIAAKGATDVHLIWPQTG